MHRTLEALLLDIEFGPVILDGGWTTELQARGLQPGYCPELWNIQEPEHIAEVARSYVEVGSRIILTNTFGANRANLAGRGLESRLDEIIAAGVNIARQAAGSEALVFGSIGPINAAGANHVSSARDEASVYWGQAALLAAAGVDGIVLETFPNPAVVARILPAIRQLGLPELPIVASINLPNRWRETMTQQSLRSLQDLGADAIGVNCGSGPDGFVEFTRAAKSWLDCPLWAKPNAGLPDLSTGKPVYHLTPEDFADIAVEIIAAGADLIGGCCGIGPAHIRALAARMPGPPE